MAKSLLKEQHTESLNIKADFPLLVRQPSLVYLDTASTSQKPQCVIDALVSFYETSNANAHRGVYKLSNKASNCLEDARSCIASYLGAQSEQEIIFTKGTTESLNIIAKSFLKNRLNSGDRILLGGAEHHANIVPWQVVARETNSVIDYIPILEDGSLDISSIEKLISPKTKIISIAHTSNILGTTNAIKEITNIAHKYSIPVAVDGAQSVSHQEIDIKELDCDFFTFSGHKAYGPMGIGVLYARSEYLEEMSPFLTGGGMIEEVNLDHSTYVSGPQKFEAGTLSIADAHGLATAIQYIQNIGLDKVANHERSLTEYAEQKLNKIEGLNLIGPLSNRPAPIFSFTLDGIHPHDIATILDDQNIAVRAGHHCSQHTMKRFNINATIRASFGIYTTYSDIDALVDGIIYAKKLFNK